MFFSHQTIIPLRFVISFCIYGRKGTYNYRHSQSKWQEKSVAGGCSMHNQRDIDTKRFAAFQGCALCVCGCRRCHREHALGHSPPPSSAPACRQAEKPQNTKSPPLAVKKVRLSPVQKQLLSCRFSPVFPMLRRPAWKAALAGHCLSSSFLLQGR